MAALITAADLGIDTTTDQGLFDWLLASMLFGRPVPQRAAASAFRRFKQDGWDTPDHFTADDRHPLWHELWVGDYHRMSSVMSEELREVMRALIADYDGSVARLVRTASQHARGNQPAAATLQGRRAQDRRDLPPRSSRHGHRHRLNRDERVGQPGRLHPPGYRVPRSGPATRHGGDTADQASVTVGASDRNAHRAELRLLVHPA
jgi:hypothetical protein